MYRSLRSRFRSISPRDAILILLGAASMHLISSFSSQVQESSIVFNTHVSSQDTLHDIPRPVQSATDPWHIPVPVPRKAAPPAPPPPPPAPTPTPNLGQEIPQTELVSHAPGWTIFRNLYMADGTLFIVTSDPDSVPSIDFMTSTGLPAVNSPESIAERMPTFRDMAIISPQDAHQRWGGQSKDDLNSIFPVEGSTVRPLPHAHAGPRSPLNSISSFSTTPANVGCLRFFSRPNLTVTWKQS